MPKKKQSRKKIRSLLVQSMKQVRPVSFLRTVVPDWTIQGIVLEVGTDWVLLASIRDGGYLDGYRVLRLGDLRRVEPETTFEKFLHQDEQWPPVRPSAPFDLTNSRTIIEAAAAAGTIISVFREAKYPGICLIGVPGGWTKKAVGLLTIDPQAKWEDFLEEIRFKDLTQISFGSDYNKALLSIAGDVPPRAEAK
jgi:hypothetical protein